ncbi:MAG: regulatory protein RecX [Schleiferiaceae bacterium]
MENKKFNEKKSYTVDQARALIQRYCSYRERSQKEVILKLKEYGMQELARDTLLLELIEQKFLNESRFSRAYARGKFNNNHWGWNKISQGLYHHDISKPCMKEAKEEIMSLDYFGKIEHLVAKKWKEVKAKSEYERKNKVAQYVIGKGFEPPMVWEVLSDIK